MRNAIEIRKKVDQTQLIAGVDEAGCGCWAGHLVVASVIMPKDHGIVGINDSKVLSERKREQLFPQIIEKAIDYAIILIEPKEIDQLNILEARMEGFRRSLKALKKVDYAIIDGNRLPKGMDLDMDYVVDGDSLYTEIGCASILAKVTRDRLITEQSLQYPGYGFEKHKGYGTKLHVEMLEKLGVTDIHRQSYKPIKKILALHANQS